MDIGFPSKAIGEFGFAAVSLAAILFAAWKLLKWGKDLVDKSMVQLEAERVRGAATYDKMSKALDEHTAQAKEFHAEVRNAHVYQREEHNKIIEGITVICAEMRQCSEKSQWEATARQKEHEKIIANLEEQYKVLLRMNGEKK